MTTKVEKVSPREIRVWKRIRSLECSMWVRMSGKNEELSCWLTGRRAKTKEFVRRTLRWNERAYIEACWFILWIQAFFLRYVLRKVIDGRINGYNEERKGT